MQRQVFLLFFSVFLSGSSAWAFVPDSVAKVEPRVAVIFSASYGGGHDASAEAIRRELLKHDPDLQVHILYGQHYMHLANRLPVIASGSIVLFNMIYQHAPKLYDHIYDATIKTAVGKTSAGDIPNPSFSVERILADLDRIKPDAIYSTWHLMTSKLIHLRETGRLNPEIPIAWLDTDFVQEPFYYLHSHGVELTFMAHPVLVEERVALGVPAEKMATTGLFINPFVFEPFSEVDRQDVLRTAMATPDRPADGPAQSIWINGKLQSIDNPTVTLDTDPDVMTVTIASGRAGVGDYATIIQGLIREARARKKRIQIVAVCGDSAKNYRAVTKFYDRAARAGDVSDFTIVASRLVDNTKLLKLVRSSQLFIGKSGSQSPFEAAVMGVPRVLIDVIGGQERHTANFFRRLGLAEVVAAKEQKSLAARAFAYIEDPARMERMRAADQVIRESYDLSPISNFFEDAIARRKSKPPVRLVSEPKNAVRDFFTGFCGDRLE